MRSIRGGLLVLLAAAGTAACGGGSSSPTQPAVGGSMKATIDGQGWTATAVQAFHEGSLISVGGANAAGTAIGLAFSDAGPATYLIQPTDAGATGSVTVGSTSWIASAAGGTGTITVSALNSTHVAGTFSFVAPTFSSGVSPSSRTVTKGTFDVKF